MECYFLVIRPSNRLFVRIFLLSCFSTALLSPLWADEKPFPDPHLFLQEAKKKLLKQGDDIDLLQSYTYRKKVVEETLRKDNTVKDCETKEYEVYPSKEKPYARLVRKNGVLLPPRELKKQDDEQAEKERKQAERDAKMSPSERQAKVEQKRKERQESVEEAFNAFYFTMVGREMINGHSALVVAFTPKPDAALTSRAGKLMFKKVAGKAWIAEQDHTLIKIALETIDSITFGAGLLAKLDKGALITQEWKKINNEIWLPARTDVRLKAKVLLTKGFNQRHVAEYSDYQKFSVSARVKF